MTRAEDIIGEGQPPPVDAGSEPQTTPANLPSVGPKSGWRTSEGQMTFIFVAVAMILSWFKIDTSADQIGNIYQMALQIFESLGPIIAAAIALWGYITSRGKQKSNAINATAAMAVADSTYGTSQLAGLRGNWGKILNIGKAIAPGLPGPVGSIAGEILGDQSSTAANQYNELIDVAKNHEGRLRTLEKK